MRRQFRSTHNAAWRIGRRRYADARVCLAVAVGLLAVSLGMDSSALAHTADKNMRRTFVIEQVDPGLVLYVRSPGPFVFGDAIAQMLSTGKQIQSPYVRLQRSIERIGYRLQREAIRTDDAAFRARLARAFVVRQHDRTLPLEIIDYRIFRHADETPFGNPTAAKASLQRIPKRVDPWLKECMIEVAFRIRPLTPTGPLTLASGMPSFEMGTGYSLRNQIIDTRFGSAPAEIEDADSEEAVTTSAGAQIFSANGHLTEGVRLDGSSLSAFGSFVYQGILHILEGIDHVLFVLCLALGVTDRHRLFWMVTGFSVGHSATLIAGFLGYTPTAPWFVPAVETLIAASIVYAAVVAHRGDGASVKATAIFGLLHGFGFSFVLGEILGRQAEGLIPSLLAFNLGVEVGQLLIIAVTVAFFAGLHRWARDVVSPLRTTVLGLCGLTALYWVVERALEVV